jgi:hypothetical protein
MSKADRYDEVITQLRSFFRKYDLGIVGKMATIWYVFRVRRFLEPRALSFCVQLHLENELPGFLVRRLLHCHRRYVMYETCGALLVDAGLKQTEPGWKSGRTKVTCWRAESSSSARVYAAARPQQGKPKSSMMFPR